MVDRPAGFREILEVLGRHEVDFVVVGLLSAVLQGAPVTTFDLDIVHDRTPQNVRRLHEAIRELGGVYRTRPELRAEPTPELLSGSGHHLLMTRAGPLDVLAAVGDDEGYRELLPHTVEMDVGGLVVRLLDVPAVIRSKEKTGRPKDLAVLPLLRALAEELDSQGG